MTLPLVGEGEANGQDPQDYPGIGQVLVYGDSLYLFLPKISRWSHKEGQVGRVDAYRADLKFTIYCSNARGRKMFCTFRSLRQQKSKASNSSKAMCSNWISPECPPPTPAAHLLGFELMFTLCGEMF